jgi:hypothetical protein
VRQGLPHLWIFSFVYITVDLLFSGKYLNFQRVIIYKSWQPICDISFTALKKKPLLCCWDTVKSITIISSQNCETAGHAKTDSKPTIIFWTDSTKRTPPSVTYIATKCVPQMPTFWVNNCVTSREIIGTGFCFSSPLSQSFTPKRCGLSIRLMLN